MSTDLIFTLIASFGIFFMGIIVYFHNRKSATNQLFFLMSLSSVLWSLANYFSLAGESRLLIFWVRAVIFFAAPHAVLFLLFIANFPSEKLTIKRPLFASIIALLVLVMAASISPFVFKDIEMINGRSVPVPGPLMPFFGFIVIGSLLSAITLIIKKYSKAKETEKRQWRSMLVGVAISYILLTVTNFIFVIVWGNTYFIKLGPLMMLPAVFGMGYAILRHNLLNVKVFGTEIITFVILSISLFEVLSAKSTSELVFRIAIFCLFFLFGVLLTRSVLKEVEQRETMEVLTQQLGEANNKLQEMDHLKSEFLSFASHQIKAPLSAIKGFSTLIYDGTYGQVPEKASEAAHKITESADRLVQLVTDFLNVRKIEEGKMEFKFERLDAVKLAGDICEELRPLAGSKKLEFSFESHGGAWINADAQRIRQVFQNLIENAIKYTDSGFVKVKAESYGGELIFSVYDSGHGLSKELIPHLFEEFRRDSGTKMIEGTGLGLFIAHEIATVHKGEISAESDGLGKGSKFILKIPLA
jgi:signal transduction histidine kinase